METSKEPGRSHASASFSFSLLSGEDNGGKVAITRAASEAIEKTVANIQESRRERGIDGPLNMGDEIAVMAYIESKAQSDLLWKLISVAAKSKGRLRSVEGVQNAASPESAIVQILLEDGPKTAPCTPGKQNGKKMSDVNGKQSWTSVLHSLNS